MTREEFTVYLDQIKDWTVVNDLSLERDFQLKNFNAAVEFINQIASVAESEGHHPDIFLHDYKQVKITLTTHAISGLSINDFVMATKIDALLAQKEGI